MESVNFSSPSQASNLSQLQRDFIRYTLPKVLLTIAGLVTLVVKARGFAFQTALIGGALAATSYGLFVWCNLHPAIQSRVHACTCAVRSAYINMLCMGFINFKKDLNQPSNDPDHSFPLMWAAEIGNVQTLQALIRAGAKLEARDKFGLTALMWAAMHGQVEAIQALIAAGAKVEVFDNIGWTALMWAAQRGNIDAIEALYRAGANIEAEHFEGTALMIATRHGQIGSVKALLQAGVNVEARDEHGRTALMQAAIFGEVKTMETLLAAHAQIDARDNAGNTALMLAAQQGQSGAIDALLTAGADINARDPCYHTALILATKWGHVSSVEALCQRGAQSGYCDNKGYAAFTWGYMLSQVHSQQEVRIKITRILQEHDALQLNYATEFLARKWLAAVWGLKGPSSLYNVTFELEGMVIIYTMHQFSSYLSEFFASRDLKAKISQEHQQQICAAIAHAVPLTGDSDRQLLDKVHQGHLIVILGGSQTHGIAMVLGKDNQARTHFMMCDRGARPLIHNTTKMALLSPKSLREELITKLRMTYADIGSFYQMLKEMHIQPLGGFQQKGQDVGNCALAAGKGATRIALNWYTNEEVGGDIYKEFTHDFMREKALKEYLDQTTEPDIDMLKQLYTKYLNEKDTLILSDEVLAKLDKLLGNTEQAACV